MKPTTIENEKESQVVPDAQLVARAKAGELSAFEALVHRHERAAYSLARRMLQNICPFGSGYSSAYDWHFWLFKAQVR